MRAAPEKVSGRARRKGKLGIRTDLFPNSPSIRSAPERVYGPRTMLRLPVDECKSRPKTPVARESRGKVKAGPVRTIDAELKANSFGLREISPGGKYRVTLLIRELAAAMVAMRLRC